MIRLQAQDTGKDVVSFLKQKLVQACMPIQQQERRVVRSMAEGFAKREES
jgi:hypothetical protein